MKHKVDKSFLILSLDLYLLVPGIKRLTRYFDVSVKTNIIYFNFTPWSYEYWKGISP